MKYILLAFLIASGKLFACSEFHSGWQTDQWIEGSDSIYHGMVVSISLDKKSIYNGESDPLINAISLRGNKHILFKVYETLKGKKKPVIKTILPECLGGMTNFGDSALLFKVKDVWHIKSLSDDSADDNAKEILAKLSEAQEN